MNMIQSRSTPQSFILIVDDIPENLQVLGSILRTEGYRTTPVLDGKQALKVIEKRLPDLILLDIMMPEMNGFEVCTTLKASQHTRDIPIIFLTAKTETDDVVKGFELGAVDYVTKPFRKEELLARVKTHLSLQQAKQELQDLNATKDKFFSIIAHDLRGPFNGFLGLTEWMIDNIGEYTQDRIVELLQKQHHAAKTLFALLENLLAWSRIQRGIMEYIPEKVWFGSLVNDIVALFQATAEQKQITLSNSVPSKLVVYADQNMIETVIRNLISNALKFTDARGTIDVSVRDDGPTIEVSVSDTGVGMDQDGISKLFLIDAKYSRVGTAGERGTGLGLILCKELVEKHGGRIWVESEIGQGTCFRFTLPKSPPVEDSER